MGTRPCCPAAQRTAAQLYNCPVPAAAGHQNHGVQLPGGVQHGLQGVQRARLRVRYKNRSPAGVAGEEAEFREPRQLDPRAAAACTSIRFGRYSCSPPPAGGGKGELLSKNIFIRRVSHPVLVLRPGACSRDLPSIPQTATNGKKASKVWLQKQKAACNTATPRSKKMETRWTVSRLL